MWLLHVCYLWTESTASTLHAEINGCRPYIYRRENVICSAISDSLPGLMCNSWFLPSTSHQQSKSCAGKHRLLLRTRLPVVHFWPRYVFFLCEANKQPFSQLSSCASSDSKGSEVRSCTILSYTCCLLPPVVSCWPHTKTLVNTCTLHTLRVVSVPRPELRASKKSQTTSYRPNSSTRCARAPLSQSSLTESTSSSAWGRKMAVIRAWLCAQLTWIDLSVRVGVSVCGLPKPHWERKLSCQ